MKRYLNPRAAAVQATSEAASRALDKAKSLMQSSLDELLHTDDPKNLVDPRLTLDDDGFSDAAHSILEGVYEAIDVSLRKHGVERY